MRPRISILIPSRNRASLCRGAIESWQRLAYNREIAEWLIRIDDDEDQDYSGIPQTTVIRGPRRLEDFQGYLDELAAIARGEYLLFPWDDNFMMTRHWDVSFYHPDIDWPIHGLAVFMLPWIEGNSETLLRVTGCTRKLYELLGYFSPNIFMDSYLNELTRPFDYENKVRVFLPIALQHRWPGDAVGIRARSVTPPEEGWDGVREEDKEKLRAALALRQETVYYIQVRRAQEKHVGKVVKVDEHGDSVRLSANSWVKIYPDGSITTPSVNDALNTFAKGEEI